MIKYLYYLNNIVSKNTKNSFFILAFIILINSFLEIVNLYLIYFMLNYFVDSGVLQKNNLFLNIHYFFSNYNFTNIIILLFIIVFILRSAGNVSLILFESRLSARTFIELNNFFFQGYISLPKIFHQRSSISTLIKNLTSELQNLMTAINSLIFIIVELVILIFTVIFLFTVNYEITSILFFFLLLVAILIGITNSKKIVFMSKQFSSFNNLRHKLIIEGLTGFKEFNLIINSKKHLFEKFYENNKKMYDLYSVISFRQSLPKILFELTIAIIFCFFLIVSFNLKVDFSSTIPLIGIFIASAYRLIPSFAKISSNFQRFRFHIHSAEKLYRDKILFDSINKNKKEEIELQLSFKDKIILKDISFTYSKNIKDVSSFVLKNLNLEIKKNEKIGIYGSSGLGKSTLLDLITGILEPTQGEIIVDERNIKNLKNSYQKIIGCVSQNVFILNDSLKRNIAFGLPDELINIDRVNEVIKITNLKNLEEQLKFGGNTLLGDHGTRLSGGQIQRIGIARAIYNNPQIIIFDESTNALDEKNEDEILKEIFYNLKNKTIIFVTHNKQKVIDYCDSVYELKNCNLEKI